MDELVVWLRAQLDEDERIARAATPGPWEWTRGDGSPWNPTADGWLDYTGEYLAGDQDRATMFGPGMTPHADAVHIAWHDPARVLREIDAKRGIVDRYEFACGEAADPAISEEARETRVQVAGVLQSCVLLLAAAYADRPGYREEWRP
ncbi:DUF6221 family protein [Streptomyces longwoodensis]|uniref:DUF6221 family protein n=1 Tax=Streptomyces longwoodensis TaxID=68231 RepID=UPI003797EA10